MLGLGGVAIYEDPESLYWKKQAKKYLEEAREELPKKIKEELERVWQNILNDAKRLCPVDTGTLRSTIRVADMSAIMSGFSPHIKGVQVFNKAIIAGDYTVINPKTGRPCNYAVWVHDGHRLRDGRFWAGVPFLTEALMMNEAELMKAIDKALKAVFGGQGQTRNPFGGK